jgi:tetratricopeptide (TPR) repeat protein
MWRGNAPQVAADLADLIDEMMAAFPGQRPQLTQIMLRLNAIEAGLPIISPLVDRARMRLEAQKRVTGSAEAQLRTDRAKAQLRTDRLVKGKIKLKIAAVVGLLSFGLMGSLRLASPQMAVVLNKQGVKHHRAGELVRAEFYYRFALLLKPDYPKVRYNLGVMYKDRNDGDGWRDRAIEELEKSKQGGVAPAYNQLALLYIREKYCDKALSLLQEGFQLADSDAKKYPLLVNLGRTMLCQNRYSEARDYLQEAIALDRDRSAAHCLMPPVLDGLGDRQGALLALEQCPTDQPPELNDWLRQRNPRRFAGRSKSLDNKAPLSKGVGGINH